VLSEHKVLQWQVPRMVVAVAVVVMPVVVVAVAGTTVAVATAAVAAAVMGYCGGGSGGGGGGGGGIGGCRIPRSGLLGGLVSAMGREASSPLLGSGEGRCEDHGKGGGGICGE
jgi:hypothetical protein